MNGNKDLDRDRNQSATNRGDSPAPQGTARVEARLQTPRLSALPGGSTTMELTVVNRGPETANFALTVEGVPVEWLAAPPPALRLAPGEEHELQLVLQPERSPRSRAGRYPLTVRVIPQSQPEAAVAVAATLTVTAFSDFRSALSPQNVAAGQPIRLTVENRGNTPETYTLEWQDGGAGLILEPPLEQVRVAEGQTTSAQTSPFLPNRPWVGRPQSYPFSVRVSASDGETETHAGVVTVGGRVSVWIPIVLVFLCLCVGTIALLASGLIPDPGRAAATQTALAMQQTAAFVLADADGDGLSATEEAELGLDPQNPDSDGDSLGDGAELSLGTDPLNPDSDGDGLSDGVEYYETNTGLLDPDSDDDGLTDGDEHRRGLNPLLADTDLDGLLDSADPNPVETSTAFVAMPTNTFVPLVSPTAPAPSATPPLPSATAPSPSATALPPTPAADRQIAFESRRDGNAEIYVMPGPGPQPPPNGDQPGQLRLTNNAADDTRPAWSPDGNTLAFISNRDGNNEIYVMKAGSWAETRLTSNPADDCCLAWSLDSLRIAFVSGRDGNQEIYVMNPDGSGQTRLTNNAADDFGATWSAGSNLLAFVTNRDGNNEIYVTNLDGSGQVALTNNPGRDTSPAWSPDGARIAFVSDRDGNDEIYVMNTDGSGQFRLTNNAAEDSAPVWSPVSQRLIFISTRDGNPEIYLLDVQAVLTGAANAAPVRLTNNTAVDSAPVWASDGARIVFASERDGNPELYAMEVTCPQVTAACAGPPVRLTNQAAPDAFPSWQVGR